MKTIGLIGKIVMFALIIVSLILVCLQINAGEANTELAEVAKGAGSWTGTVITWGIVILAIGIVAAVISLVFNMFTNPSGILKSLLIFVGVVAIVAICWFMSDGTPLNLVGYDGTDNQSPWLEIADTGIFLAYISLGAAIIAIITSEVAQRFK